MAQNSFALMTNLGRAKEAAALANGTAVVITHIAIGDGTTVPSGGETALYNEVARKAISGHGTVVGASNVAYFDIFLAAAEGPYTIREAGLYDDAGDLIAIARYDPPINKPVPASGQTVEGTVRLEVAFSNIANVTIVVDPSFMLPLQRLSRLPWIPVLSMTVTAPPASPALGDAYLVPAGSTGSWAGQAGKIAEYTAAGWGILTPPDGHGLSLPDGRVFEKIDGVYIEKLALDVQSGKWGYAVAAGSANALTATLTPAPTTIGVGLVVRLKITTTNTGISTLNVNGKGDFPIRRPGNSPLRPGDLIKDAIIDAVWTGDYWQVANAAIGPQMFHFPNAGYFSWEAPKHASRARIQLWGAGGGGGGGVSGAGGAAGSGGGGGGYAEGIFNIVAGQIYGVTVGAPGVAGASNGNGGSGGSSSVGSLLSATGGGGGFYSGGGGQSTVGGGGFGSGGQFQSSGQTGGRGQIISNTGFCGNGGGSYSSSGAAGSFGLGGGTGSTPGGGGSGGADGNGGGNGGGGYVIIETF